MPDLEVYIPLSEYLPSSLWPSDLFATEDNDFLDSIAYDDGIISSSYSDDDSDDDNDTFYANVSLRVIREIAFQLPAGFAFVLGRGTVHASVYQDSIGYTAQVFPQDWKLRLPRSLFIPAIQSDGKFNPDPDPTHFVDINLPIGLNTDSEGTLDLVWSEEEVTTFQLPSCLLGETGIVVAGDFILRLSENQPLPEGAAELGLETDWQGLFISNIRLESASGSGELVLPLLGSTEVSLVLDSKSIQAIVTFGEDATSFGITAAAKVRFQPSLLQPMRKIELADGDMQFEPDLTRPHTDINLDRVGIAVDTAGKMALVGSLPPIHLDDPVKLNGTEVVIESADLVLDSLGNDGLIAFKWHETNLSRVLRSLAPNFAQQGSGETEITLRIVLANPIKEIRLDWQSSGEQTFSLPGVKALIPADCHFSLLLNPTNGSSILNELTLIATLEADSSLVALSRFAWERGGERELLNNDSPAQNTDLFRFTAIAKKQVSLVLLRFQIDDFKVPCFFKQLNNPLDVLDFDDLSSLSDPTDLGETCSLRVDSWNEISFNLNLNEFELPFLKQTDKDNLPQVIQISRPGNNDPIKARPDSEGLYFTSFNIPLIAQLNIQTIQFKTDIEVNFNWETFALSVNHDQGIMMISDQPVIPDSDGEMLGLKWRFKGAPIAENPKKYHYFTLVTKDYNYQVQQAKGALFEVDYIHASNDPITFSIADFALTPKGINLRATVTDRPVKLNGIDTRFRFHGSGFEIKENRIADFTLAGSGPLPPALVGDAIADIALQFTQREGSLGLVAGSAKLQGSNLLNCRASRFQFQVDAISLKFVNDGRYHLYFTLTGSAQFVLAAGDDRQGALALLPNIKIDMVDCPLTGDARVLSKHIKFLVEMPKPVSFNFLGCYEFELRAFGFLPQAAVFEDNGAMELTGQLKFAQGAGDTPNTNLEFHRLLIGLPEPGKSIPRLYFADLPVNLNFGAAFKLSGSVEFKDSKTEDGFSGDGIIEIQGLPTIAASFGFFRVRQDESSAWVRAWFIYLEVQRVSYQIPVIQLFLREVGLGFGYRYTLVSLKAADRANSLPQLIKELTTLSRTQGDLSKRDRWSIDLEPVGADPRWTIALRAMISQTSASLPLKWNDTAEQSISCLFLFDAVIALRSDLTFFMVVRAWLNTNYYDYTAGKDRDEIRSKPLFSGFVLLSPRQKRFLAHIASNPEGYLGSRPELPNLIKSAIRGGQFSTTLLIEPGLFHYEMGWPNMLRWSSKIGDLQVEMRGGFIFRVSKNDLVIGSSYIARASLTLKAGLDKGMVGCSVSAVAEIAYGARFIGVVDFQKTSDSAIYGAISIEAQIRFSIEFWLGIKVWRVKFTKTYRFSLTIGFTAGLEMGLAGESAGLRGTGTVAVSFMGHSLQLNVKLGVNESAVEQALNRTRSYLQLGLEATDIEGLPGMPSATRGAVLPPGARAAARGGVADSLAGLAADSSPKPGFKAPNYVIFVIRDPGNQAPNREEEGWSYFILLPEGPAQQAENGSVGFLPTPPSEQAGQSPQYTCDFKLINLGLPDTDLELMHFAPSRQDWVRVDGSELSWKANWKAQVLNPETDSEAQPAEIPKSLEEYLCYAFRTDGDGIPIGDPDPLPQPQPLTDDRVQNPTDSAYEAAVRGAVAQFRSSPFFKPDPNLEYDQILKEAFQNTTTIYSSSGKLEEEKQKTLENQQIHQLRGMIVHDLVADLRQYAGVAEQGHPPLDLSSSIAFQMGLVFRFKGNAPGWLIDNSGPIPTIQQRLGPNSDVVDDGESCQIRTFNIKKTKDSAFSTDFSENPPQLQQVKPFTDANTIAIAWNLRWDLEGPSDADACHKDPEHHLLHYQVRRRPLDGSEAEVVYTAKTAEVLHRQPEGTLRGLKPRFQIVDHFNQETLEDLAALPSTGKSYLYTITPVDFTGKAGRPLTLIATRYPNEPPRVPVDGKLVVEYHLSTADFQENPSGATKSDHWPRLITPNPLTVGWSEPLPSQEGPQVPIAEYRLIFRKELTLPVGSYGFDSTTQRSPAKALPTTNARQLPTDIVISLKDPNPVGQRRARSATIPLAKLQTAGVFPQDQNPRWKPEAWRVFFQTVSDNGVPSALAPVELVLRVKAELEPGAAGDSSVPPQEERQLPELEWLPYPTQLPLLPPEDGSVITNSVHVPMPSLPPKDGSLITKDPKQNLINSITYQSHPGGLRCVRFRWNQGSSQLVDYPLDLNAGYQIYELDIDANTTETFRDSVKLGQALQQLQTVQMLPAEDLLMEPNNTLTPNQWEAWYPSTLRRRQVVGASVEGSQSSLTSWYSWRDSILEFPPLETAQSVPGPFNRFHPCLKALLQKLDENYTLDVQIPPPMQAGNLAAFFKATPPQADPYGWSVLQRFGLSVTLALYDKETGKLISGEATLAQLQAALANSAPLWQPFLHVELLFQAGRSVSLQPDTPAQSDALLGMVQVSLRPIVTPLLEYHQVKISGPAKADIELILTFANKPDDFLCSIINQADLASGEYQIPNTSNSMNYRVRLPLNGETTLLLRGNSCPTIQINPKEQTTVTIGSLEEFEPTDKRSTYFLAPTAWLASQLTKPASKATTPWQTFLGYLETLISFAPGSLPTTKEQITQVLPAFLTWSQRFFDASGDVGGKGPWLVTAYPRAGSPAYTTPDANGRLTYDHLLEDRWAHNYRYYIQPVGRYGLLWSSLRQFFLAATSTVPSTVPSQQPPQPDPHGGGLDLVLERTHPVAPPLVLHSARLDAPSQPGKSTLPGITWEVIVAQHPEQALIQRNQTLARQLSFRQVAFTLLRRFAFTDSIALLENTIAGYGHTHQVRPQPLENQPLLPPSHHPVQLDHLALPPAHGGSTRLGDGIASQLDIPLRLGDFQQGALVLQWEALPFFYEHRLLLIAQTSNQVSAITPVTQRDFEYLSPVATAILDVVPKNWTPTGPFTFKEAREPVNLRLRQLTIPLKRLWDCLPPRAQEQWPWEAPDPITTTGQSERKLSALPDLEVVYQIIERFSGNLEVQAELLFDKGSGSTPPTYSCRQLGQRILAEVVDLLPPPTKTPHADYTLVVTLQEVTEEALALSSYQVSRIAKPTFHRVALQQGDQQGLLIKIAGVLTLEDRNNILVSAVPEAQQADLRAKLTGVPTQAMLQEILPKQQDRQNFLKDFQTLDRIYQEWFIQEPISRPLNLPADLATLVDFPEPQNCTLVWSGPLSDAESSALAAIEGDDGFKSALQGLIQTASQSPTPSFCVESTVLGLDQVPKVLQTSVTLPDGQSVDKIAFTAQARRYTGLTWTGVLYEVHAEVLKQWAQIPAFSAAVEALINQLDNQQLCQRIPSPWPLPEELPAVIAHQLQITSDRLTWIGPAPTDTQRSALQGLQGNTRFLAALGKLLAQVDADRSVTLELEPPRRPQQAILKKPEFEAIRNQLEIRGDQLIWRLEPDPQHLNQQLEKIRQLQADRTFNDGITKLINQIAANQGSLNTNPDAQPIIVTLDPEPVPRPKQADLPEAIRSQLQIDSDQLTWIGPAPTDQQRSSLSALSGDENFGIALDQLIQSIDANQGVDLVPEISRPRDQDLPAVLRNHLSLDPGIEPTQITWQGRLQNEAQLAALNNLSGDAAFNQAIQAIVQDLQTQRTRVEFDLAMRPQPEDLAAAIGDKLLIGRSCIRYHGLMTVAEGRDLQRLCQQPNGSRTPSKPDRQTIERLYSASLKKGWRGRSLELAARRGSACPQPGEVLRTRSLEVDS